jgi:hypothetical protein
MQIARMINMVPVHRVHIVPKVYDKRVNLLAFASIRHSLLMLMKRALNPLPAEHSCVMSHTERFRYALVMYVHLVCYVAHSLMNSEVLQERDTPSKC